MNTQNAHKAMLTSRSSADLPGRRESPDSASRLTESAERNTLSQKRQRATQSQQRLPGQYFGNRQSILASQRHAELVTPCRQISAVDLVIAVGVSFSRQTAGAEAALPDEHV